MSKFYIGISFEHIVVATTDRSKGGYIRPAVKMRRS